MDEVTQRVLLADLKVPVLRGRADRLRLKALELKENATLLQEANVDGALKLTTEAQRRSQVREAARTGRWRPVVDGRGGR